MIPHLESRDSVITVGTGLAIGEAVEKTTEAKPLGFFPFFPLGVLEIAEILFFINKIYFLGFIKMKVFELRFV